MQYRNTIIKNVGNELKKRFSDFVQGGEFTGLRRYASFKCSPVRHWVKALDQTTKADLRTAAWCLQLPPLSFDVMFQQFLFNLRYLCPFFSGQSCWWSNIAPFVGSKVRCALLTLCISSRMRATIASRRLCLSSQSLAGYENLML